MVLEETDKSSSVYQMRSCVARKKYGQKLVKPLRIEKNKNGKRKPKLDNARRLNGIYFIDQDNEECSKLSKMREESWKDLWHQLCAFSFLSMFMLLYGRFVDQKA